MKSEKPLHSPDWAAIIAALGPRVPPDSEAPPDAVSAEQLAKHDKIPIKTADGQLRVAERQGRFASALYRRGHRDTRLYWPVKSKPTA